MANGVISKLFEGLGRYIADPYSSNADATPAEVARFIAKADDDAVVFANPVETDLPQVASALVGSSKVGVLRGARSQKTVKCFTDLGLHPFRVIGDDDGFYGSSHPLRKNGMIRPIQHKEPGLPAVTIKKAHTWGGTTAKQLVTGVVIFAGIPDSQGEIVPPEDIEDVMVEFMLRYVDGAGQIGLEHVADISNRAKVVECWLSREDSEIDGMPVPKGSWMMTLKILDSDLWAAFKDGTLSGFSFGGYADVEE